MKPVDYNFNYIFLLLAAATTQTRYTQTVQSNVEALASAALIIIRVQAVLWVHEMMGRLWGEKGCGNHAWFPSGYQGSLGAGWDVVEKYILARNTDEHNRRKS